MKVRKIDINSDLGEGYGNDADIMPFISSCNIACGGHFGTRQTIKETIDLAIQNQVKIGAHPSYPDKYHFGRKRMDIPFNELLNSLIEQIEIVKGMANQKNQALHHIKLHGALYLESLTNWELSENIAILIETHFPECTLYAPYMSKMADAAIKRNLKLKYEVFADRKYLVDLTLVDRKHPFAILTDPAEIMEHVMLMVENKKVKTLEGKLVPIVADTLCIHGDHPKAISIAKALFKLLSEKKHLIK
ncbi:MAG: 5-oxoprolinase subunit PxpA [Cyclobacteriaceae bacterium]